jgi:hypothetical protein
MRRQALLALTVALYLTTALPAAQAQRPTRAALQRTFAPGTPAPKITLVQGGATIDGPRIQ